MEIPFKAFCINDAARPSDIPTSRWVKKGELYTVTAVARLMIQGGRIGFKLAEINLDGCYPYEFYDATRFAIILNQKVVAELELNKLLHEAIEEEKEKDGIHITTDK